MLELAIVSAGLIVAALLVRLWRYLGGPLRHSNIPLDKLQEYIEVLLHRGYPNAFMTIALPKSERFLQIIKLTDGGVSLRCDFPLAPWSKSLYDKVVEVTKDLGCEVALVDTRGSGGEVAEFALIELTGDLHHATNTVSKILTEALGLAADATVELWYTNVSARDDPVGFDKGHP